MSLGMRAYHKHKMEPPEEIKQIWNKKEKLIKKILAKSKKYDKCSLSFKTPSELSNIFNNLIDK